MQKRKKNQRLLVLQKKDKSNNNNHAIQTKLSHIVDNGLDILLVPSDALTVQAKLSQAIASLKTYSFFMQNN